MTQSQKGSEGQTYIAALTGLRGIAAFFVFLFHFSALHPDVRPDLSMPYFGYFLNLPLGLGFAGVDLFFVLSGFLLTLPFARDALNRVPRRPLGGYLKRRLLRVFPAYYAQWAIIMLAGAWFVSWKPLDSAGVLAHLFMFFNIGFFDIGPDPVRPIVGLWWTLPVELSFYLLLPFIVSFMQPRRWVIFLGTGIVLSVLYRVWAVSYFAAAPGDTVLLAASHLPGTLPEFLLGASAAILIKWMELKKLKRPPPLVLDLLFLTGAALAVLWLNQIVVTYGQVYWRGHWSMVIAPVTLGASLALMVLSIYWGSRVGKWLCANPPVYYIGLISYSLYLWHFVLMQQLQQLGGETYAELSGITRFALSTLLVIGLSSLSYVLFERPFFRVRGKRQKNNRLSEF